MLKNDSRLLIDTHVNVPDGGVAEATYTYLRPNIQQHSGDHRSVGRGGAGGGRWAGPEGTRCGTQSRRSEG